MKKQSNSFLFSVCNNIYYENNKNIYCRSCKRRKKKEERNIRKDVQQQEYTQKILLAE